MKGTVVLRNESNEIIAISVELMDLKDVARYLHLHYETVRRWAAAGEIPAVKVGGAWRVYDLEAWLNKQRVGGASNTNERSTEQNKNCPMEGCVSMLDRILTTMPLPPPIRRECE